MGIEKELDNLKRRFSKTSVRELKHKKQIYFDKGYLKFKGIKKKKKKKKNKKHQK